MSWVTVLIIVFVVAMAVGPIMWFRSTPMQRRLVDVRSHAARLGLRVRLMPIADLNLPGKKASSDIVAAYCLIPEADKVKGNPLRGTRPWRLAKERIVHESHFDGYWDWQKNRQAEPLWHPLLREVVTQLPADALALEYDRGIVCVYWRENGGLGQVEQLAAILQRIVQQGMAALALERQKNQHPAE